MPTRPTVAETARAAPPRAARVRPVPAVSRSIAILRLLGRSAEPLGVNAIAQALGMIPSTCLHILRVLVHEELLKVDPATKRYSLGVGMLPLARTAIQSHGFATVAQPTLDRLAAESGATAIGVEVQGLDHLLVVALARSRVPFSLHVDVGSRFPALISATGRLVAAYSERPWSEIERRFRVLRWQQAPDLATWRKEIEVARRKGYSVDRGSYINGVTVVSVPILDGGGRIAHALVIAGMADRLDRARSAQLAQTMRDEAARIAGLLYGKA